MRIVALPSIYQIREAAQPKRNRMWPYALLVAGVIVTLGVAGADRDLAVAMICVAFFWALTIGFYIVLTSRRVLGQGEYGERQALRSLASLPDEYVAITNCKIPGYEQIGDLDIVVLGPPGVVVIEIKNIIRPLVVDGDHWSSRGKYSPSPMNSASRQLRNEVQALAKYLDRQHLSAKVNGLIAINSNASVQIVSRPPYPIVPYDSLAQAVLSLPTTQQALLDVIERKLCSAASPN